MKKILCAFFASVILTKTNAREQKIIDRDELIEVLVDLEVAKAIAYEHDYNREEIFIKNVDEILVSHNISLEKFEEVIKYYCHRPKDFSKIYQEVHTKLKEISDEVESR